MSETLWKNKLAACLHDPPCKALDIYRHEDIAKGFLVAELGDEAGVGTAREADRTASSCDRFPFPKVKAAAEFNGTSGSTYVHPFAQSQSPVGESGRVEYCCDLKTVEEYEGELSDARGAIEGDYRQKFFWYWRCWRDNVCKSSPEMMFFPADTRIPDHSIWNHLDVTSALEGCRNPETNRIEPAFLLFQAGPVQGFIAAARSTRDLWSGSYMLSWLMGNAMKAVTDETGPDSVIFPALRGNGIFDVLNKDFYEKITFKGKDGRTDTLWQRLYPSDDEERTDILLNPTLPNRFFAVVPAYRAEELAQAAEQAFRDELRRISESCYKKFKEIAEDLGEDISSFKARWDAQVELLPEITWQVMPVDRSMEHILDWARQIPGLDQDNMKALLTFLQETMPQEDRDGRYYSDASKTRLSNWGITWGAHYAMTEYALSARRNLKEFKGFKTDDRQEGSPKDALTGKEETIGSEELWGKLKQQDKVIKKNEGPYGAITLIKRLWCRQDGYLHDKTGMYPGKFSKAISYDSVPDVATKNEWKDSPYVAVIAMDGDEMGKWLSGAKAPVYGSIVSGKAKEYFATYGLSGERRFLNPAWHLQFSEALANFSNHVAGKIIKAFAGQLIYAGGDDVLVMLPADKALACAFALRRAFRGDESFVSVMRGREPEMEVKHTGFMATDAMEFLMPGPGADVSCGIAIAHMQYPLQGMVEAARRAESRAKHGYGRSAFAMSLIKRSGEIVEWGAKWNDAVWDLYKYYTDMRGRTKEERDASPISARFPYALAGLLEPYRLGEGSCCMDLDVRELIEKELCHVMEQQIQCEKPRVDEIRAEMKSKCDAYLERMEASDNAGGKWDDFVKLFLAAAFIERDRDGSKEG